MLEKPDLQDTTIIDSLRDHYGLKVIEIVFLPLGADRDTAVYRAITEAAIPYFVKLRRGFFDGLTVEVPRWLYDHGLTSIIAPFPTRSQSLWTGLGEFNLMVFPFVAGHSGCEVDLTDRHWIDLGRTLKAIHTAPLPPALIDRIPRESYSARWRVLVKRFQDMAEFTVFSDPVAAKLAALLKTKRDIVNILIRRAEDLAAVLRALPLPFVLCHADIHAANVLIDTSGRLYVIDWDTLTLAPKERDLMFVGGGQFGGQRTAQEEETLFYQGYGETPVNPVGLAYYRYERIVQDIAAYCEQILLTDKGGPDRENGLRQLTSQFLPGGVVEFACRSEKNLPPAFQA